jgi:glycosyltransferase involved in cell wall biosynthesis
VEQLGIEASRIGVVEPGTEPAPEATGPGPGAPPRILCVAAVTPGKGQDVLVRALDRLAAVPWTCACAGSLTKTPAYSARVERLAREAGISRRIAFPGECDQEATEALYRTSSIFVLPSFYEGYGMALAEAMARGLPVVSTRVGAIPDTVPGEAGILVPPGDEAALADALRLLLEDPPDGVPLAATRRAQLGAAGRRHASRLPDCAQAAAAFAQCVSAFAQRSSPPHGGRSRA